jgi:hypothetical protein
MLKVRLKLHAVLYTLSDSNSLSRQKVNDGEYSFFSSVSSHTGRYFVWLFHYGRGSHETLASAQIDNC